MIVVRTPSYVVFPAVFVLAENAYGRGHPKPHDFGYERKIRKGDAYSSFFCGTTEAIHSVQKLVKTRTNRNMFIGFAFRQESEFPRTAPR